MFFEKLVLTVWKLVFFVDLKIPPFPFDGAKPCMIRLKDYNGKTARL